MRKKLYEDERLEDSELKMRNDKKFELVKLYDMSISSAEKPNSPGNSRFEEYLNDACAKLYEVRGY